jgi:hypothetical protein
MALIKVKELIGTSEKSFEDALNQAVKEICKQKQKVSGVKVIGYTIEVKDGKITEHKVNVKYAYRWEEALHGK